MFERSAIPHAQHENEQATVRAWFNATYQEKGLRYLRPPEAYGIYRKLLAIRPNENVLDVACGPGLMLEHALAAGANAYGVDLSDAAIALARRNLPDADTRVANAERLPFANNSMDVVTCLGSLERMLNLQQVFDEMVRIGRKNARYLFLVRNSDTLIWRLFMQGLGMQNQSSHQGANSLAGWRTVFADSGLTVENVLSDQWPPVRWRQALTLGLYRPNPLKLRRTLLPLTYANEFIFILRKP